MLPKDKQLFASQLRRRQLQKQLPLHDLHSKFCDSLTDKELQKFQKFAQKRKTKAAGIGTVVSIPDKGTFVSEGKYRSLTYKNSYFHCNSSIVFLFNRSFHFYEINRQKCVIVTNPQIMSFQFRTKIIIMTNQSFSNFKTMHYCKSSGSYKKDSSTILQAIVKCEKIRCKTWLTPMRQQGKCQIIETLNIRTLTGLFSNYSCSKFVVGGRLLDSLEK